MKITSKERIERYKMFYKSYHWLTNVESVCLKYPGELSASEMQDLSRLKSSFALGLHNCENHAMSLSEVIKAKEQLQKEYGPVWDKLPLPTYSA